MIEVNESAPNISKQLYVYRLQDEYEQMNYADESARDYQNQRFDVNKKYKPKRKIKLSRKPQVEQN